MYDRALDLRALVEHRSLFVFGPRQTGKSTLVRQTFPDAAFYDLLEADTFHQLSTHPEHLRQTLEPARRVVVIDEIQKCPPLLDEVHLLIERNRSLRFVLTGSSARKLKRGGANLLAGRARVARLHPLVSAETEGDRLLDRINRGGLPAFLDAAEQQINFTAVASDAGLAPSTVREHYRILEDTLVGEQLPVFRRTRTRKPVATAKFYFFDVGVANTLRRTGAIERGSDACGRALEHLVFLELRAWLDYRQRDEPLTYWRSQSRLEVDFVIGDAVAIEVKAKSRVSARDCKGLLALAEEVPLRRKLVVCHEPRRRRDDNGVEIVPVQEFLDALWSDGIIE